jgi:hypothetical protein
VSVALTGQNATKPFGGGEVASIKARSLNDGEMLYVTIEWRDKTLDDTVNGQTIFGDSAAIEFPTTTGIAIPSFCMGDATGTVNIWHWKAHWQRDIETGFTTVQDRYPDGFADEYPWATGPLYYPARSAGNILSQTDHVSPVENLVAASFGTLTTADLQDVGGNGVWKDGRWRVVFARELSAGPGYASMEVGDATNLAFAVWDGSRGHRDGIKSVSQFMNLRVSASLLPEPDEGFPWWGWAILAGIGVIAVAGLSAAAVTGGRGSRS